MFILESYIVTMYLLKIIIAFTPILTFGQQKSETKSVFNIYDFSDSRFDIDSNGFHGCSKADTTYYSDGKIAFIGHYAMTKNSGMSGNKFGLSITYYHNGQIKSQGNCDMYSLLYYQSPTKGRRIEHSYKVGEWIYYYDNGQIKAIGKYQIVLSKSNTGIDNQFYKLSKFSSDWNFFNPDGCKSNDIDKIITDIVHNPNCD